MGCCLAARYLRNAVSEPLTLTLSVNRVLAFQGSHSICRLFRLGTHGRLSLQRQRAAAVNPGQETACSRWFCKQSNSLQQRRSRALGCLGEHGQEKLPFV